ncbi:Type I secretion outer membrane protein [Serratia sp. M24T3]|nr:Type I secretion outer membrane protein [Serratia sp. M24T3]
MKHLLSLKKPLVRASCSAAILGIMMQLSGCHLLRSKPPARPAIPANWQAATMTSPVNIATGVNRLSGQNRISDSTAPDNLSLTAVKDFWSSLGDPDLPRVLQIALRQNDNLKLSQLQLKLSRLQAALTGLSRWPTPSVSLNAGVSRPLKSSGDFSPETYRNAGLNAALSYPLDIWGSTQAQRQAADLDAQASEDDWHSARLAIRISVAQSRWQIAYLNRLLVNAQADLKIAADTSHLAEVRYQAGATSRGEVIFAQRQLSEQRTILLTLVQQREEARHAFSLLMGDAPQQKQSELTNLDDIALPVPAPGLPADLLSRRADVHAAELRLLSSLANADAVRLSFYPSLNLTASYGTSSPSLTDYLANPVAALATVLTLPMVQFNTARYTRQSAEVVYQANAVSFKKTLYNALRETEDALTARQQLAEEAKELAQSLKLSQQVERLTLTRWQQGGSDIQPWLEAQRTLRQARIRQLENVLARKNNALQLYAALGGDYAG